MCGIAGVFFHEARPDTADIIARMCAAIRHRGPDDAGQFVVESAGVGMRRLSIIDLANGQQPMFSPDKRYVIVYNGELYNYPEIQARLIAEGQTFATRSDTEVVLKAFLRYGEECLNLFNGMYAFAIYDQRRREFFLARDRLGVKPLYYSTLAGRGFAFASELKALLTVPGFDRAVDETALNQFFVFEYIPQPRSIYQAARKVPAAAWLRFSPADGVTTRVYWEIDIHAAEIRDPLEAEDHIRDLMRSAVRYRLVSDVPVGLFLSGGMDSSIIAAVMRDAMAPAKPLSFSIAFAQKSYDESPYAQLMADYLGLEHESSILSEDNIVSMIPEIYSGLDEPLADASVIPTFLVSQQARRFLKVALSGDGGDELFLGYDTYRAHQYRSFFQWMPPAVCQAVGNMLNVFPPSDKNLSWEFKAKKFFNAVKQPADIANVLWWGAYSYAGLGELFVSGARNFEEVFEPVLRLRDKLKGADVLKQISYLDVHLYLRDNLLPKVDRTSMANSLEVRNPFLDYRLAEYAFRLPSSWKLRRGIGKYILRRAYQHALPKQILARRKKGFDIPLTPWLRGRLRPLLRENLSRTVLEQNGRFNRGKIQTLIDEHCAGKRNHRQLLWPLLTYHLWQKKFG
ncbi:MAG: asparagine synthase (glutamine-hydrolyzing) [Candidatus Omnitrophica bacterium]|nr:asparagine synthase (glutamine-hydrolyzing) [Candidatus Omnitrophota bacterium]